MTGTYTFRWDRPAGDVYVTGTFDNWSRSTRLERQGGAFVKTVTLPIQKTLYKFVVDGHWATDPHAPYETEPSGIQNSVLQASQIEQEAMSNAHISSVAPNSTTAALAAQVPLEEPTNGSYKKDPTISSVAPGSSTADMAAEVPVEVSTPAPNSVPGFFPETPANEKTETEAAKQEEVQEFSVKPLPASDTAENPIILKPGEPVPTDVGSQSLTSNVHTDKESYERGATNFPVGSLTLPEVVTSAEQREKERRGVLDLPPIVKNMIPESSLPIIGGSSSKEPAHAEVPEVVKDSQQQAHVPAEASEVQESVDMKAEVEKELAKEVPPAPAISEDPTMADKAKNTISNVTSAITAAVGSAAVATGLTSATTTTENAAPSVPAVVRESQAEAGAPAEASAIPEVVEAKKEVEQELKEETVVASPIPTPMVEEAPTAEGSTPRAGGITLNAVPQQNADATQTQTAPTVTNGITLATTQSTSIPTDSAPKPVSESVAEAGAPAEATSQPAAVANKAAVEDQLKKEVTPAPVTAGPTVQNGSSTHNGSSVPKAAPAATPPPTSPNGNASSKKSKRRSFFSKLKDRLHRSKKTETS